MGLLQDAFADEFSDVEVRLGRDSETKALGASAFTTGSTITFGGWNPDAVLVAHELAHVVQNRRASSGATGIAEISSAAEQEAVSVAGRAARGARVRISAAPQHAVQRSRDADDIARAVEVAVWENDLVGLIRLLGEVRLAHKAATRWFFSTNADQASAYRDLGQTIERNIRRYTAKVFPSRRVVINAHKMAGRGDLVLARNCADILVGEGFAVCIVSNAPEEMRQMARQHAAVIQPSDSPVPEVFRAPAAFVHVGGEAGSKSAYGRLQLHADTPLVKLLEYGFSTQAATRGADDDLKRAFGLGPKELGIFIDEALLGRAKAVQGEDPDRTRAQELLALTDQDTKRVLFDTEQPDERTVRTYLEGTDLYFGYGHSRAYVNHFVNLVLAYEHMIAKSTKNRIDIFTHLKLPQGEKLMVDLSEDDLKADVDRLGQMEESFQKTSLQWTLKYRRALMQSHLPLIEALGIGTLEIITRTVDDHYVAQDTSGQPIGPRRLRLIDLFPLDPVDYNRLLVASGDLSLATGDQSFSQALAANKMMVYEIYTHKVPHFDSWLALAKEQFPEGGPLVNFLEAYTVAVSGTGDPKNKTPMPPAELRKMLGSPEALREQFTAFNAGVAGKREAGLNVVTAVREAGALRAARWQDELEAVLTSIDEGPVDQHLEFAERVQAWA